MKQRNAANPASVNLAHVGRVSRKRAYESFVGISADIPSEVFAVTDKEAQDILDLFEGMEPDPPLWSQFGYTVSVDGDSESSSVLLKKEGKVVGFYEGSTLWIEEDHQGKGLSTPLILAAAIDRHGELPTVLPHGVDMHGYSPAGLQAHDRAFAVLWAAGCNPNVALATYSMAATEADFHALADEFLDVGPNDAYDVREYEWTLCRLSREDLVATGMLKDFAAHARNIALDPRKSDLTRPVVVSVGDGEPQPMYVWDGVHRILSALARDVTDIPAIVGVRIDSSDLRMAARFGVAENENAAVAPSLRDAGSDAGPRP